VWSDGNNWDDIRFCTRTVASNQTAECYSGGYYVARHIHAGAYFGTGVATVPKKYHARIKISNVYDGYMLGSIINETIGNTLHDRANFSNGQVIELPYSDIQDQTFRFYAIDRSKRSRFGMRNDEQTGIMVLYIDQEKMANLESWTEANCSEI
jgi:hypothetical protein